MAYTTRISRHIHSLRPLLPTLLAALLLLGASPASGHDLRYRVEHGEAVHVQLAFPHGESPVHEAYEIFPPDSEIPFQTGRSDARGRISFIPDRPGEWRVRITTEDGHGLQLRITVDEAARVEAVSGPGLGRAAGLTAGLGYLAGLTGLWLWWRGRRGRRG